MKIKLWTVRKIAHLIKVTIFNFPRYQKLKGEIVIKRQWYFEVTKIQLSVKSILKGMILYDI